MSQNPAFKSQVLDKKYKKNTNKYEKSSTKDDKTKVKKRN